MGPMLMKMKKKISFQNFKNPKGTFVRTIEKIIQEKFDKFLLRFVEEMAFFLIVFSEKVTRAQDDPK